MDPKELAAWAAKFAKKGARAAVRAAATAPQTPPAAPIPPYSGSVWGPPAPAPVPFGTPGARPGATWGRPPELDTCVKAAPSPYAQMLAGLPELAPDLSGGANALAGTMSPDSQAAYAAAMGAGAAAYTVTDSHGRVVGSGSAGMSMDVSGAAQTGPTVAFPTSPAGFVVPPLTSAPPPGSADAMLAPPADLPADLPAPAAPTEPPKAN